MSSFLANLVAREVLETHTSRASFPHSSTATRSVPQLNLQTVCDADSPIPLQSYVCDDPLGYVPKSYASMLQICADIIGIGTRSLERKVREIEPVLL